MEVLSLDLSTHSTGFAIFKDGNLKEYGCLEAKGKNPIERIYIIIKQIEEILDRQENSNIERIIAEEVRPENNQTGPGNLRTHKVLMWLQAALEFLNYNNKKIKIEYIYPSEWRAKCGIRTGKNIKRDALKQKDIDFVKDQYGIEVNDDIADAIGIGYAYLLNLEENVFIWE